MTKIFMVRMSIDVAVAADDTQDAYDLADYSMFRAALADCTYDAPSTEVLREIKSVEDLGAYGWGGLCIPYGDTDGNTRLKDILEE